MWSIGKAEEPSPSIFPMPGLRFQAEWLDPRTGARKAAAKVEGGAKRTFSCPDAQDWVLHLNREE